VEDRHGERAGTQKASRIRSRVSLSGSASGQRTRANREGESSCGVVVVGHLQEEAIDISSVVCSPQRTFNRGRARGSQGLADYRMRKSMSDLRAGQRDGRDEVVGPLAR